MLAGNPKMYMLNTVPYRVRFKITFDVRSGVWLWSVDMLWQWPSIDTSGKINKTEVF